MKTIGTGAYSISSDYLILLTELAFERGISAADLLIDSGLPEQILFQPGVPVVLQGAWKAGSVPGIADLDAPADDGWHLRTDHMVVKHDNDYRSDEAELETCGAGS